MFLMESGISPPEIDMTEHRIFTSYEWDRIQNRDHRVITIITSSDKNNNNVKLVKFDSSARVFWGVFPLYSSSPLYNFQNLQGELRTVSKESFLGILSSCYPEDYEFFIWHPSAANGIWNE